MKVQRIAKFQPVAIIMDTTDDARLIKAALMYYMEEIEARPNSTTLPMTAHDQIRLLAATISGIAEQLGE